MKEMEESNKKWVFLQRKKAMKVVKVCNGRYGPINTIAPININYRIGTNRYSDNIGRDATNWPIF